MKKININYDASLNSPSPFTLKKINKNSVITNVLYKSDNKLQSAVSKTWRDNVYSFNKNLIKHVPLQNINATNLLKYYFSMFNKTLEKKIFKGRKRHINRLRRLSVSRILISKIESRFTANKVLINLFAFNPEKRFLIKHLSNVRPNLKKGWLKLRKKRLLILKKTGFLNKRLYTLNKSKYINLMERKREQFRKFLLKSLRPVLNSNNTKFISKKIVYNVFRKRIQDISYKYLIFLNNSKFNDIFILKIIPFLEKIYNKKINMNIINLKYFYMNSELMSRLITIKLRKRSMKMFKLLKKLRKSLSKYKMLKKFYIKNTRHLSIVHSENNMIISKLNKDISLKENYFSSLLKEIYLGKRKGFLRNVNYKYVNGILMKIKGRLTRRFTAARSVKKVFNKGSIKDYYSRRGMSSTMTKGYLMPSVQYTNINYKTRVGAYGIKGWLGSL